ncbi:HAMP domain-containing sensor histidine kinase [Flavobacterium sp.]|uniref:sensor histidine kinase n=1 Tax=Flavobacterium sp. TaxID=239 RepID=UPI00120B59B5|nr:HAMP domain-containing sensor histidine kinase [Flavobacterium sp.]RZJ70898.1 MAG: HAMP domain-containing histidine kinase [Flavobacterium sp.]
MNILNEKMADTDENVKARNINFVLFVIATMILVVFAYSRIRLNAKQIILDGQIQSKLGEELAYQNQQLNDFANITSHNLRSSSSNMQSLVSLVDEESSIEEYKNIFAMMKKVAHNLHESLNDLIEILRIKKNKALEKESVSFDEVFDKVVGTLQGDILNHKASVTSDFAQVKTVMFSKIYLESVLQNLIGNAMKYKSPERLPEIKAWTQYIDGEIALHIQDNGLGIDLEKHGNKVFGMYQMFHKHPEAKGIGLFITKAQIENLGGTISVESDGKTGTTFIVKFGR